MAGPKNGSKMSLANAFAKHLDNNEFLEAKAMIAESCIYKFRDQTLVSPDAIIECYQGSFDSVADQLDEVVFESSVEELPHKPLKCISSIRFLKMETDSNTNVNKSFDSKMKRSLKSSILISPAKLRN